MAAQLPVIGTITKAGKGQYWRIPSQPEEISVKHGASMQTFKILNLGAVTWQRGLEPTAVSWDGTFFGETRMNRGYLLAPGEWVPPVSAVEHILNFMEKKEVLLLFISDTDINFTCQVTDFDYKYSGGYGDIAYSITFKKYEDLKVYKTKTSSATPAQTKARTSQQPQKILTVSTRRSRLMLRTLTKSGNIGGIIDRMPKGSRIETDGQTHGNWRHVKYNGKWGWAYGGYLK